MDQKNQFFRQKHCETKIFYNSDNKNINDKYSIHLPQQQSRNLNSVQIEHQNQQTSIIKQSAQLKKKSQIHKKTGYRADIDGLRTIAITLVLIFHGWPQYLTGGYIGVDVFFVISGYLITGIILKQAKQNKFSYIQFYSRRVKRIYPALVVVLIFTFIMGMIYLPSRNLSIMSKTMTASTVFSANLQILTYQQDYFDPQVKTNPLLHLWSLGVQQQFYIFWPLFISIIVKMTSIKATLSFIVFLAASFAISIYSVYESSKFDFYFPFCRFWQMAVGGFIVYFNKDIQNKFISNIISICSCLTIFYVSFVISEDSLFPGFWALAPTLSSAFIILTGNSFINQTILSHPVVVFVGKISYPLYLWHWPLLVFSRILYPKGSEQIFAETTFIINLAIIFSIITYYLVENKLRFSKKKGIVFGLLIIMILIGSVSFYTYLHPQKISLEQPELKENEQGLFQGQQVKNSQQEIQEQSKQTRQQKLNQNEQYKQNQQKFQLQEQQLKQEQNKKIQLQTINQRYNQVKQNFQMQLKQKQQKQKENIKNFDQLKQNLSKNQVIKNKTSITQKIQDKQNKQKNKIQNNNTKKPIQNKTNKTLFQKFHFKISKQFQYSMIPGSQDFIIKNNTKIPNASKNKNRLPITKQKVQYVNKILKKYLKFSKGALDNTKITPKSKYYQGIISSHLGPSNLGKYHVTNQGKQNKLFFIGDSFSENIAWRFRKLYQQSLQKNQRDKFPTIVHVLERDKRFTHCSLHYKFTIDLIKKHKPKRVFFCYFWLRGFYGYNKDLNQKQNIKHNQCPKKFQFYDHKKSRTSKSRMIQDFDMAMKIWQQFLDLGIEIYTVGMHPFGRSVDPRKMTNNKQVIKNNIKSFKLSQFRKHNQQWINYFENTMKKMGVKIVDFTQNHCFNDICQVATPNGYPIYVDSGHYTVPFSTYWISAVDFLTKF